jgi:hypothetical protein
LPACAVSIRKRENDAASSVQRIRGRSRATLPQGAFLWELIQ